MTTTPSSPLPAVLRELVALPDLTVVIFTEDRGLQAFVKVTFRGEPSLWPLLETRAEDAALYMREQMVEGPARLVRGDAPVDPDRFIAAAVEDSMLVTGAEPAGKTGFYDFQVAVRYGDIWLSNECGGRGIEPWMLEDDADHDGLLEGLGFLSDLAPRFTVRVIAAY